jgi:hypothetical protein
LKGNQGTLHEDVVRFLDDPASTFTTAKPNVDADHGRTEPRTATVSTDIEWLQNDHRWPGLKAIGKVDRVRETPAQTTTETAYYLLSTALSAERFNEVVRQHWGVENRLHWRLDVVMNEDQDRTRMGNGPQNLAFLLHGAERHAVGRIERVTARQAETSWLGQRLPHPSFGRFLKCDCPGRARRWTSQRRKSTSGYC